MVANVVLIISATALALTFFYFFYRYSWIADRQFTSWRGMLIYYVVPAVLAALLFAALRLKRDYRINLAIVWVALVLSVYGGELVLDLIEPPLFRSGLPIMDALRRSEDKRKLAARLTRQFGVEIDTREMLEVITDLSAKGIDAVPSVIPRYQLRYQKPGNSGTGMNVTTSQTVALGGISNRVTVLCNESGQYVIYDSDEHGFRNAKGRWQSGHVDIVALGDSFTQGHCVSAGKYFMDIVGQQYPSTLNLGMAGEGPLLMLSTLEEYVPAFRPKVVLWFYFEGNDLLDLRDERRSALLMRYLDEDGFSQRLLQRQSEINRVLLDLIEKEKALALEMREARIRNRKGVVGQVIDFAQLPRLRARLGLLQGRHPDEKTVAAELNDLDLLRRILSRAKAAAGSWGGTLHFVYLPTWARFIPQHGFDRRLVDRQHGEVLKIATDLRIPIVDVLPAFEGQRDPTSLFPFGGPGHYAENGHRLVADEVLKAILPELREVGR
jgi:hypothetical protein